MLAALAASPPLIVIVQHSVHFTLPEAGGLARTREVRQGDNVLSFYAPLIR